MAEPFVTEPPPPTAGPRRRGAALALLGLLGGLVVAQTWGFFGSWDASNRVRDWVVYLSGLETTRSSLREARALPAWDPWRCGGAPHLADPFVDGPSPWAALAVLWEVTPAARLSVLGHLLAALLGMWWWARQRRLDPVPAFTAAVLFGLSGFFVASILWGLSFLWPAAYLPWLLGGYEAGRGRPRLALAGAVALALMILEGGAGVAQASLLLLGLLVLVDLRAAWAQARTSARGRPRAEPTAAAGAWRAAEILRSALVVVVGAALLAAVKWVPAALYLQAAPAMPLQADSLTLTQLVEIFVGRDLGHRAAGFRHERFAYLGYMGPLVVVATAWGLWRVREAELGRLFAVAGLWCLLLLGDQGPWLPYAWLDGIAALRPLVNVPAQLAVALGALLALVAGLAVQRLLGWLRGRWPGRRWQLVLALLPALVVVDQVALAQRAWRSHPFVGDPLPRARGPFHLVEGDRLGQLAEQRQNRGTIRCHARVPVPASPRLRRGVQAQAWLDDSAAGSLKVARHGPGTWVLDVSLAAPARALVNQNFAPGWSARGTLSATVRAVDGLLALELPAGKGRVTVAYQPPGLLPAAAASALGWLALLLFALRTWFAGRRRRHPY